MLHWQLSDFLRLVPRRVVFFTKLFLFCLLGHLILLTMLFFVYKGDLDIAQVIINTHVHRSNAPVVYVPWIKRVHKTAFSTVGPAATKKVPAKTKKKNKTVLSTTKTAKNKKKKTVHKRTAKLLKKKTKEKVQKSKAQEKKKAKKQVDTAKELQKTKNIPAAMSQAQEPNYIGRYEKDALELEDAIRQEIMQYWKPPAGFIQDAACTLAFFIDWDGVAQNITISESSGILVVDLAARTAIESAMFPAISRGKEMTLTLK